MEIFSGKMSRNYFKIYPKLSIELEFLMHGKVAFLRCFTFLSIRFTLPRKIFLQIYSRGNDSKSYVG